MNASELTINALRSMTGSLKKLRSILYASITIFAFLFVAGLCHGQETYFNITVNMQGEWGSGMSVIERDSAYYVAGIGGPGYKVAIARIGFNSTEADWVKSYGISGESWYPGNPKSLCQVSNNNYILGGSVATTGPSMGQMLMFNGEFDTLFSRRYYNDGGDYLVLTNSYPCFDGGYIFTGEITTPLTYTDFLLLKTDSEGNELWRSIKNFGVADRGWSVIQSPDSGYVVGGYSSIPGIYHSGDPIIARFDKYGTFQWSSNLGGEFDDGIPMLNTDTENTFVILTTIADSIYVNDLDYNTICVMKYTYDGTEVWQRKYGESIGGNFVSSIRPVPGQGYICCGKQWEPGNNEVARYGWLLKIKADGDSTWFRRYAYYNYNHEFYFNKLQDVYPTSDGGYIATGEVYDDPPNNLQRMWVIKLDSLGCDSPECNHYVDVTDPGPALNDGDNEVIRAWPNPCSRQLNISLESRQSSVFSHQSGGSVMVDVYDMYGRKVLVSGPFADVENEWISIDVSSLPPGPYLMTANDGFQLKASTRFIVTR